jgi:DNA-binding NarL/FixJ family response regulator
MERSAGSHDQAETAPADHSSQNAAIALVDRRPLIRELVASYLRERISFPIFQADSTEGLDGRGSPTFAAFVIFQPSLFVEIGKSFSNLARIRQAFPDAPIVVVSDFGRYDLVAEAFRYGARGFIPTGTSLAIFEQALRTVLAGGEYVPVSVLENSSLSAAEKSASHRGPRFTPRQQEVLELLREGLPNKMIAYRLDMRESTVKVHLRQIMRKMNATNRTQVVASLTNSDADGAAAAAGAHLGARLIHTTTA